jgi:hypothetical protein
MSRPNHRAKRLLEALHDWNAADAAVEAAAKDFLHDLLSPSGTRGTLTHAALERLKHHLGFDRYGMPASLLDVLQEESNTAVLEAARRAGI